MSPKKRNWIIISLGIVIVVGAVCLYVFNKNVKDKSQASVIVPVKTAKIKIKEISKSISAYGTVIPAPGAIDVISVPFESYISRLMVNNGQMISKGDALLEIQPSQNTYLSFSEAKASFETAKQTLQHVRELLNLKLATNDQFLNAQLVYQQATLRLENMKKQGIESPRNLLASVDGLINMVNAKQGAIVPAGTTLVEIVAENRFEINLGIEAEDITKLKTDQRVFLSGVYDSSSPKVVGTIRKLAHAVNPTSRLVDIFVTLPSQSSFLLGELVLASIQIKTEQGMVVPRSALLTDGSHFFLFTVRHGSAIKHTVDVGIENDDEAEVFSATLSASDDVVILGNYELSNGIEVQIEDMQ